MPKSTPCLKNESTRRGVRNASQSHPYNTTHRPSFPPVENTHGSSSSPFMQAHSGDLRKSYPTSESHSSSSPVEPHANLVTSTSTNILPGARDFVINFQGDSSIVVRGMNTLSGRVIEGAEYDSSLRDPPPQCHPGTRVQLMEKILTWFRDAGREKALLWLSGPAGVGKSAIIQTVAESLAESSSVGATLFFSRLNDRNDSRRVVITIAFQLATRIPAYQVYITKRIALDPSLLRKSMKDQFRIFITEPFGINEIGKKEGPWAVLLDGLDECEGVNEQSRIIKLVSEFVLRFPNAPLIWAIASRPEPHIVATFDDEAVISSYWSEYVPVDSTQACRDVEHYFDASFEAMRKQFRHLPSSWPSESQFLKLSNGARGLFVFAKTAVYFMEDHDHADPVSRLDSILSIIDHLNIEVIDYHPFALLDALYTQILMSIPSPVWHTTKRLLGFVICARPKEDGLKDHHEYSSRFGDGFSYPLRTGSRSFMGASIILDLELNVAYASLHKLHSVLDMPDSKNAHQSTVRFLHASFGDYLKDQSRSKDFYIDRGESVDDIERSLFQLHLTNRLVRSTSQPLITCFSEGLRTDVRDNLVYVITGMLRTVRGRGPLKSQKDRSDCLRALSQINFVEIYKFNFHGVIATLLTELWNRFRAELVSTGGFKEISLRDLKVDHLDDGRNEPIFAFKENYPGLLETLNGGSDVASRETGDNIWEFT